MKNSSKLEVASIGKGFNQKLIMKNSVMICDVLAFFQFFLYIGPETHKSQTRPGFARGLAGWAPWDTTLTGVSVEMGTRNVTWKDT